MGGRACFERSSGCEQKAFFAWFLPLSTSPLQAELLTCEMELRTPLVPVRGRLPLCMIKASQDRWDYYCCQALGLLCLLFTFLFSHPRGSVQRAQEIICTVLTGAQYTFALHHLFTIGVQNTGFFLLGNHKQEFRGLGVFCKLPRKRAVSSWSLE